MAHVVIMPQAGQTMEEGTIVEWLKQEGDPVLKGEPLMVIMTDKANLEIESDYTGVLSAILATPGDGEIPCLKPVAIIAEPGEIVDVKKVLADYEVSK